jgi:hypothetical protein
MASPLSTLPVNPTGRRVKPGRLARGVPLSELGSPAPSSGWWTVRTVASGNREGWSSGSPSPWGWLICGRVVSSTNWRG